MSDFDPKILFEAIEISSYDLHPDGRKAICSVSFGKNRELAFLDLRTGALKRFLSGPQSLMSPRYSPDGSEIAYQMDFEGDENHDVVLVSSRRGKAKKLTDGVADNYAPEFSPDGSVIAFTSNRDKDIDNLFLMPADGGRIRKLSREPLPARSFSWSPDGIHIAYATGVGDDDYVSLANVRTGKTKKVLSKKNVEYSLAGEYGDPHPWSPDGTRLLFLSNEHGFFDVGELDIRSGKTRWLVRSEAEKHMPRWSPDGSKLAYLENSDPKVVVKILGGRSTQTVSPPKGSSRALGWLTDGSGVVYVNSPSTRPEEVFISKLGTAKRLTRFQSKPLPKRLLVKPRLIKFRSFDGLMVPALLYSPRGTSRRAGIVYPHGGPEMQDTDYWDQLTIMLLEKGFNLIKPNYRGSTGYGRKFLHLHDGDLGGGDFMDTVWAGKYLLDSGLVDPDRLGYWGASYSGFTCMLSLTKYPEMWAAGVCIVGFFDWETEHENERGYLKAYDESKMGDFLKNPERFRDRSPIYFLDRLRAPLLMTASSKDVRCPPTESRAVVAELKRMGKKYEYHEYPDEGHWPRKRKNLMDLYKRSTTWLDDNIPG
jgi:dipeptidyl aminopeptidase/acylaminoacyl peptidase